jgi:hypothetical protein
LPAVHADLASSLHNVGFLHMTKGSFKTSKDLFAAALQARTQLFGAKSVPAMTSRFHLAFAQTKLGDLSAEKPLLEVLEFQRARLKAAREHEPEAAGPAALECSFTLITLCGFYAHHDQILKAAPYLREAQQVSQQISNKDLAALAGNIVGYLRWQVFGNSARAEKDLRQALTSIDKVAGKHHYLYLVLQRELAISSFKNGNFTEAEKIYLDLEASWPTVIGGDGESLADLYYNTARSIQRGVYMQAAQLGDLGRCRTHADRMVKYAHAAYQLAKQLGLGKETIGIYAVFLAHARLYRPDPDNAGAEKLAREALGIRTDLHGIGHALTSHPRAYLFLALARQNKVAEIEKTMHELLQREPRPKWDHNAGDALPEAARKLALAGKTKTALVVLEQVARAGFYNLELVRSDPAFAALRETEEYRQLVKRMSK